MSDPAVIADQARYAEVGREYRRLERRARARGRVAHASRRPRGRARAARRGRRRPRAARGRERGAEADRGGRGGNPPRDGRGRPERREERPRRDPRRHRRRRGVALRRRPLQDAHPLRRRSAAFRPRTSRSQAADMGGFKEATFAIKGDGAFSVFKFEGGTHRVQRVPKTESQGRIHTSTATVAVLPEAEEVEVEHRPERPPDRRLPLVGAGRPVGQHDRLGGAHHAQAVGDRRLDAGREVAASEPGEGDARAARPPL